MKRVKKAAYYECTIMRRFTRTHSTINMETGAVTSSGEVTVHTEACRAPLFGDLERATGVCNSCARGWESPEGASTSFSVFRDDVERTRAKAAHGK